METCSALCLSHIQPRTPYDFYHPYDFLPVRPSEAPVGIYVGAVLVLTSGYGPRTAWHGCILMVWLNISQDSTGTKDDAHTGIARVPHGNLQCFSYPTGRVRGPCVTRNGAVRRPSGHVRELTQPELANIPHGRRIWPYGARKDPWLSPHRLFTCCVPSINPYGARKLIMHALKLYGPHKGRQNSCAATRGPCLDVRFLFKTAREQPVRARKCDMTKA